MNLAINLYEDAETIIHSLNRQYPNNVSIQNSTLIFYHTSNQWNELIDYYCINFSRDTTQKKFLQQAVEARFFHVLEQGLLSLENGDAQFIDSIVDVTVFPDYWQRSENYYFCQFVGDVKFTNEFLFWLSAIGYIIGTKYHSPRLSPKSTKLKTSPVNSREYR